MTDTARVEKIKSMAFGSAERIREIWTPLRSFLTSNPVENLISPKKTVSASIEDGGLAVAYCSRSLSKIQLKGVRRYLFPEGRYPQPKDVSSSLALSLNEFGAPDAELILAIPKAWVVIRTAEFPSTIRENIAGVVSGEMDRLTPFSADEALFDFRVLREINDRITLLVMAVRSSSVMPYINDLRESGYTVSGVTAGLSGLGSLCLHLYEDGHCIIVEEGEREYVCSLFAEGFLTKTLSGALAPADEESRIDAITGCVRSLMETAERYGNSPGTVAIGSEKGNSLAGLLQSRLEIPVRTMEGAGEKLGFAGDPDPIPYAATGCAVQSMRPGSQSINLLKKGITETEKTPVLLTVILLCALVVTWIFYLASPLKVEEKRLEDISRQIALRKDEAVGVEGLKKEIQTLGSEIAAIESFKEERPMRIDILLELTTIIPDGSWLSKTRFSSSKVEIEGYAGSAVELLPKLDASGYFSKVEFTSPTIRDANMKSDRFKIRMEVENVAAGDAEEADGPEE